MLLFFQIDAGNDVATILREHISVDHREFKVLVGCSVPQTQPSLVYLGFGF